MSAPAARFAARGMECTGVPFRRGRLSRLTGLPVRKRVIDGEARALYINFCAADAADGGHTGC